MRLSKGGRRSSTKTGSSSLTANESHPPSGNNLAEGPLRRAIPLLAVPMVLEMATEALFAICDVYFVGKIGPDAVAAVGLTESLLAVVYSLGFGIAMPASALVAHHIGAKDPDAAALSAVQAVILGGLVGVCLAVAGFFGGDLLGLMGAANTTRDIGSGYASVALFSSPWIILLFTCAGLFRGAGDARRAMRAMWLANGINLVLDPCLIFGLGPFPELGVTGASVATTIGRATGVFYLLYHLYKSNQLPIRKALRFAKDVMGRIASKGIGGTTQHLVETGCWVVMTRMVAGLGRDSVAGYTIATRLIMFTLLPIWGFSNATATLVGQSLGAKNPKRAERAIWLSGFYCTPILALVSVAFVFANRWMVTFFSQDPAVIDLTSKSLFVLGFGFVFYGWQMITQQAFNGSGDTTTPALINVACLWCIQIPLAYYLGYVHGFGLPGVIGSAGISYSIAALIGVALVKRGRWKVPER